MSEKKPGAIRRLFVGLWNALNFTRRLVFNLLFLFVLLIVLAAIFGGGKRLQDKTALVIAPRGELVEQFTADPTSRAFARMLGEESPETQLRDVLRAIEAAAKDSRIDRIVLRPDMLGGAGLAALREINAALREFRKSGKEVVAFPASRRDGPPCGCPRGWERSPDSGRGDGSLSRIRGRRGRATSCRR